MKSLFGRCTRRVTPASIAATIAGLLTACTLTCTPTFLASSTIALSTSISACGGAGSGVSADLTGVLDAPGGQRLNRGPRFRRRLPEVDLARGDDARADELALVDAVAQRDVGVGLPAAGEDGGVARLEQRPHLPRRVRRRCSHACGRR